MPDSLSEVEIQTSPGAPPLNQERLKDLLREAIRQEGARGEVGLWITNDDEMADLHQRFMSMAGPTDVMSFPGDLGYLGDIAVSYETAARQAADAGHSTAREIAYLALHGLLHLLGYDDTDPDSRARMFQRQNELIESFEREHPGDWD
jgi:probable rRNA maturation factor